MVFIILWFSIAGLSEYLVWGYPLLAALLALFFVVFGGYWIYRIRKIQTSDKLSNESRSKSIRNLNIIFSVAMLVIYALILLLLR
jgi:ABC-type branched-subunit amino acid transport system permease subunit